MCTLDAAQVPDRVAQWRALAASARSTERIDAGVRLVFDKATDVASIATLAHAEQQCCSFFTFTLTIDAEHVALEVRAPQDAQSLVDELLATA